MRRVTGADNPWDTELNIRKILNRLSWALQRQIVPTLRFNQDIYKAYLNEHMPRDARWLDAGCGHKILPEWELEDELILVRKAALLVGCDRGSDICSHRSIRHRLSCDLDQLPFASASFDLVTSNMVIEHLEDPLSVFKEFHRVLSPGGQLLIHTPNVSKLKSRLLSLMPQGIKNSLIGLLQERKEEDIFSTRYLANQPSMLHDLLERAGFKKVRLRLLCSSPLFLVIPPLALFELIWIRIQMLTYFRNTRPTMLAHYRRA